MQYQNVKIDKIIQEQEASPEILLDGIFTSDRDMEIAVNLALLFKQCKQLSLADNKITSVGALILCDALNDNTSLKELSLNNNDLSDIGIYLLCKTLTNYNSTLEKLNLASNGITDEEFFVR
ncbi:unnamed protein product [Adineta steineri]|uniref:Uncharacterized protein n=1 Tax=Adineta steineri TaxID=433720 RepID=A0A814H216_9BILA|nr:unnamed protein product [Adineta steineri]CAF1003462.1 unnamed protein product [Adineta steineri]CAF1009528.1 unnamed protein product [Adineta steineri]CAF3557401.1 unnamed protein product [Adineta steineri]CAF3962388.1 unnamed protein product [Adineta steineri]